MLAIVLAGSNKISLTPYSKNLIRIIFLWIVLFVISFAVNYWLVGSSLNNLLWATITYGSMISFLIALLLRRYDVKDIKFVFSFLLLLTLFEILIGYLQMVNTFSSFNPFALSGAAGDYFTGTFVRYGYAHLAALKISLVLIYVFVIWVKKRSLSNSLVLLLLVIGWLLPSALYSIILLAVAIGMYYLFMEFFPRIKHLKFSTTLLFIVVVASLALVLFIYTQQTNIKYLSFGIDTFRTTILEGDRSEQSSQKVHFIRESLTEIPERYPQTYLIGVGPGNYSSRAAWIVSGLYLSNQPEYIPVTPSEPARKFALPYFEDIVNRVRWGAGSVIHQPFSSWVAIYLELGILGLFIVALGLYYLIKGRKQHVNPRFTALSNGNLIAIFYVILLMFVDNILEYPHFINQFLMLVVMISNVDIKSFETRSK